MKIENRDVTSIFPYANNPRDNQRAVDKVVKSIREFGFQQPIVVDEGSVILAGHTRLLAALKLRMATVPTVVVENLTEEKKRAFRLMDNRSSQEATWNAELLKLEFEALRDLDYDLELTGFETDEINNYLFSELSTGLVDEEEVPALAKNHDIVIGDIFELGPHRLMCGDSTNPLHVEALYNLNSSNLMVTDPPYGVNYDANWRNEALGGSRKNIGKVLNDDISDWSEAYSLFTGNVCYVWSTGGALSSVVQKNLEDLDFEIKAQIIWVKNHFAISRADYHGKHEVCWYAVKKGNTHNWQGDRKQSSVWEISNAGKEDLGHSTQKPLECMLKPILNNSKIGDYIYDPFGGTGTTLIACEKSNRKCLTMELNPDYVEIIRTRWENFTGNRAKKL